MRGEIDPQQSMFSYVDIEDRIPATHPIRDIRAVIDRAIAAIESDIDEQYSSLGRPSIPPEQLLRALYLQIFYSVRSERLLVDRIEYDLLFRWFVGLGIDDPVWSHSTFSKNRDRVLTEHIAQRLFDEVKRQAYAKQLMSRDHFSVDGTLMDACASMKSFVPKQTDPDKSDSDKNDSDGGSRNEDVDFRGQKRRNDTHESSTDPDARLFRKGAGQSSRLCMMGHILIENRNGMIVEACVTTAGTSQEWEAALVMLDKQSVRPKQTVGADKGYDVKRFVDEVRDKSYTPHVAARTRGSAVDERTTGTEGYKISQRKRKRVEEPFGWMKTIGTIRKLAHRGLSKVSTTFLMNSTAFNIRRIVNCC
ncbi:transposase [Chromatiales bacterium (ex Bugula neritina AB1)]|nr:transposase [Chromatiales bacterium (ex Bugula neritina AB1)]